MHDNSVRRKRNKVPILSKPQIDEIAQWHIDQFCPKALERPMEIDVDSFAFYHLGLKQDFQYLSHNGTYLGMMVFSDTTKVPVYIPETNSADYISAPAGTIIIDNNLLQEDQEHRYRFTMGHEIGHNVFHKEYFGYDPKQIDMFGGISEPLIQCRIFSDGKKSKPVEMWNDKDSMEWQANYFAAALLMPKSMVISLIKSIPPIIPYFRNAMWIREVVVVFNVSWQAAGNRLRSLGIIN